MSSDMEVQIALDGMPDPPPEANGNVTNIEIQGPADAAFKTARWGLDQVRQQLVLARAERSRINAFIAEMVKQERYLARMARIAEEFDREGDAPPAEE